MSREISDLKSKLSAEIAQFSSGKALPSMAIATARHKGHLKGALALEMASTADELDSLRNLLSAGDLESAEGILGKLSQRLSEENTPDWEPEVLVDHARLFYFQGDYVSTLEICTRALTHTHTSLATRLTLLQIQLASQLELQQTAPAQRTIKLSDSLREIMPHHPVSVYLDFLKIRWEVGNHGVDHARSALRSFMTQLHGRKEMDPNDLHSYLRARTELDRLSGRPDLNTAVACAAMARQIGDDLYHALDLMHVALTCGCPDTESLRGSLPAEALKYEKVLRMLDEMAGTRQPLSYTAASFLKVMKEQNKKSSWETLFTEKRAELGLKTVFVFIDLSLVYDFRDHGIHSFGDHPKVGQLLRALSTGEKRFFEILESLWGLKTYDSHRHGPLIRNLISRARKTVPVPFTRSNESVACSAEAVLL